MKIIPIALQEHYNSGNTSVAYAILMRRSDGQTFGFTSHDTSFSMNISSWYDDLSTIVFDSTQGLDVSSIVTTSGLEVDNLELVTLDDGSLFDREEVLSGAWNNSEFRLFRYRWDVATPTIANDVEILLRGWTGNATLGQNTITLELRGLTQKLQQPVGIVSTKTCRARLGSTTGINKCRVDLTSFTHDLVVTSVTDKRVFTCSGATQADDYFGAGIVTFNTGNNAGVSAYVNSFAGGVFTLQLGMVLPIQVGDTLTAVAGCRKRLTEDCKNKFNNVVNFQGEPHRPTPDSVLQPV